MTVIHRLHNAPKGLDDYTSYLEEAIESAEETDGSQALYAAIFGFIEEHPEADLGVPGPLVHFIEGFYPDYVDQLKSSVVRLPTSYTLWMVNRILNAKIADDLREELCQLLHSVSKNEIVDPDLRKEAREVLDGQERA